MPPTKGRPIKRLSADDIALRRDMARELAMNGHRIPEITSVILNNPATAYLLPTRSNALDIVDNDLRVMEERARQHMERFAPVAALATYREQLAHALSAQAAIMSDPHASQMVKIQASKVYHALAQSLAHSHGIPVDRPAIAIDLKQLIIASGVTIPGETPIPAGPASEDDDGETIEGQVIRRGSGQQLLGASAFGLVDAYTFATHPDFCNLNLDEKPMERRILEQFMSAGAGYNELVCICGMRSGKGTVGSVIVWYKIYRLLELSNPQKFYGLTAGQSIGTVNMALSEPQAKANVFKHIKDRIQYGGRWFEELRAYCDINIPHWNLDLELRLPKNLYMRCGHSRASSQVGGTNIAVIFDELCKYKDTEGTDNAENVYKQMKATTATFGEESLVVSLSSPEWDGDYGMRLLRMATERDDSDIEDRCETCRPRAESPGYETRPVKSHPRMYGLQLPTWEANTTLTYERLWDSQDGAANPRAFNRDFGAQPTSAQEGYYPDPERWDRQPDPALKYPYDSLGRLAKWFKPCCPSRRFVHVDLAVSRDAAGIAMAHKPIPGCPWHEKVMGEHGLEDNERARKAVVDVCVQVKPQKTAAGRTVAEIDFDGIRNIIRDWQARGFDIKGGQVSLDGFQSVDFRQQMRKESFRTAEFSLDRNLLGHDTLQGLLNTDDLAYQGHPVLIREGKQAQLKNGRKVDHPPKGSKDCLDAVAGAVYHAVTRGGRRTFIGGQSKQ